MGDSRGRDDGRSGPAGGLADDATDEALIELMQVGYLGLLKAIGNFNPELGPNLVAYAQPCVSGELKRHFRDKRWQVQVQRTSQEHMLAVRAARASLTQELGRSPGDTESTPG